MLIIFISTRQRIVKVEVKRKPPCAYGLYYQNTPKNATPPHPYASAPPANPYNSNHIGILTTDVESTRSSCTASASPSSHESVNVVNSVIGLEVCEPDVPLQLSPLVPDTLHDTALVTLHETTTESPDNVNTGDVDIEPDAVGVRHTAEPVEQ